MIIGFSTGDLLETEYPLGQALANLRNIESNAIEFQYKPDRVNIFEELSSLDFSGFEHISIHAPKIKSREIENGEEILETIQKIHEKINLSYVVFHPDEVDDWKMLKKYTFPVAVENNDWRKSFGKNVEDLKKVFAEGDFKFVLDVNHCYTIDKSMKLAQELLENLGDKLIGIHVSGFAGFHDPIYITNQDEILKAIPNKNVPIIIESFKSAYKDVEEAKKEIEYIKSKI